MAKTVLQQVNNIVIKEETISSEYVERDSEPLPIQCHDEQDQQMATVKAELVTGCVTTQDKDEVTIKEEIDIGPTEFLPQYLPQGYVASQLLQPARKKRKTSAERQRAYRLRQKELKKAQNIHKNKPPKKSRAQYQKEYRLRVKLRKHLKLSNLQLCVGADTHPPNESTLSLGYNAPRDDVTSNKQALRRSSRYLEMSSRRNIQKM